MKRKIRAAVSRQVGGDFSLEELDIDTPRDDEVLIRVSGVGICHTDLVARDQIIPVPMPIVLGHEASGVVEQVGGGVDDLAAGDKVVLTFSSCGHCSSCADHSPAYCRDFAPLNFLGRRLDGTTALSDDAGAIGSHFFGQSAFAERVIAPRRNVVRVESDLPVELLGPLGCGIQTGAGAVLNALDCADGSSLVIFGAGSVGMSAVMAAAARGCAAIIVVEPVAARRQLAIELGATYAVDPAGSDDLAGEIRKIVPAGADYSIDMTGVPAVIEAAVQCLAKRGVCALVAAPQKPGQTVSLRFGLVVQNGARIVGVMEGDSDPQIFIPELLAMQAKGRFPFEKLLTTYPFPDINHAISEQAAGRCLKPILVMSEQK